MPPCLVKIGQKDGCQMRRLIFHLTCPPPSEVSGSATGFQLITFTKSTIVTFTNKAIKKSNIYKYIKEIQNRTDRIFQICRTKCPV